MKKLSEERPQNPLDLRLFILLAGAGLVVWAALTRPALAAAIASGLSALYLLNKLIGR